MASTGAVRCAAEARSPMILPSGGPGVREATEPELVGWCVQFLAELLERPPHAIDPQARFSRVGLDSSMAIQLIIALEERLDVELSPDLILDYPSIAALSAHLANRTA